MPLEAGTFISDLVPTNPPGTDLESQGANHLRLIKSVLQNTFPVTGKAFNFPQAATKTANYSVQKADFNTLFVADTTGGVFTFTLPTLVSGDAGWFCEFIKFVANDNPFFIAPPSGTLQSGEIGSLASTRRCIVGRSTRATWTGSQWFCSRVPSVPVGTILDNWAGIYHGYEWPNGQTLASASTNYPEYFAVVGSGITPDIRQRAIFGTDLNGAASSRITVAGGNYDGTTVGQAGGGQNQTLLATQIPSHTHGVVGTSGGQSAHHTHSPSPGGNFYGDTAGSPVNLAGASPALQRSTTTSNESNDHTHSINITSDGGTGGGLSHPIMPPSIVMSKILVVE